MIALVLVAAVFVPFPVGPPATGGVHITVWAPTPLAGLADCRERLSWYGRGEADCRVVPESAAPDVSRPGWSREFTAGWAS